MDVVKEIKKKAFRQSLGWSLFFGLGFSISEKLGFRKNQSSLNPMSWEEMYEMFPIILALTILSFFCIYWWSLKSLKAKYLKKICPACNKTFQHWEINYGVCDNCGEDIELIKTFDKKQGQIS